MNYSPEQQEMLKAVADQGLLQTLQGSIGALHDHLEREGLLENPHTRYLVYRLRRDEALSSGSSSAAQDAQRWQDKIVAMENSALKQAAAAPAVPGPLDQREAAAHPLTIILERVVASQRTLCATFVPADAEAGFDLKPVDYPRVVFHEKDAPEKLKVLPADVVKSITGQVTFEIVPGCSVPKAEASRMMHWVLESMRLQAVAAKAAGLPVGEMRTAPRMKR